jgi:amidohydrolase
MIEGCLAGLGLTTRRICRTGVVTLIPGRARHPILGIRFDMDALPMRDEKKVPYASRNDGVAHACGHDAHTAMGIGVARLLTEMRDDLQGSVKVIFQPAEETPSGEMSGARAMIEAGVLDDPPVCAMVGVHCWPDLEVGQVGIDYDHAAMASADNFRITVHGKSAHAGTPEKGIDAILVAASIVVAVHHVVRGIAPHEQAALNIGTVEGGQSQSILADKVQMTGTLRTVSPNVRDRLLEAIARITDHVADAYGANAKVEFVDQYPPTVNDRSLAELFSKVSTNLLGEANVIRLLHGPMTSEDFSYYLQQVPGVYVKVGTTSVGRERIPLHHPLFDVDEDSLVVGTACLAAFCARALEEWNVRD